MKISRISYEHIRGTSASPAAINFDCSQSNPCWGIKLQDINLTYHKGSAKSSCRNAGGNSIGVVIPRSCLWIHTWKKEIDCHREGLSLCSFCSYSLNISFYCCEQYELCSLDETCNRSSSSRTIRIHQYWIIYHNFPFNGMYIPQYKNRLQQKLAFCIYIQSFMFHFAYALGFLVQNYDAQLFFF